MSKLTISIGEDPGDISVIPPFTGNLEQELKCILACEYWCFQKRHHVLRPAIGQQRFEELSSEFQRKIHKRKKRGVWEVGT